MKITTNSAETVLPVTVCCECGKQKRCRYSREINRNSYVFGKPQFERIYLCEECYNRLYDLTTGELKKEFQEW